MRNSLIEVSFSIKDLKTGMSTFRNKPLKVSAKKMKSNFEINSTSTLSGSSGKAGDWIVLREDDCIYCCEDRVFSKLYEEIKPKGEIEPKGEIKRIPMTKNDMIGGASIFRKRPLQVSAKQIHFHFSVETKEGIMIGRPGDWLIGEFNGGLSLCRDEDFQSFYQYEQLKENSDKDP